MYNKGWLNERWLYVILFLLFSTLWFVNAAEIKVTASDGTSGDQFGWTVAIDGDYMIVGASSEDDVAANAGAAYIYFRNQGGSGNWGEVIKLTASDAAAGDQFGISVSISGDDVVVGSNSDDDGATNAGSAYIFNRNQGGTDNWGQVTKLVASDPAGFDLFGNEVTINGDDVAIWAAGEDDGGTSAGAVYVYNRNQGGTDNWGQVKKLVSSDSEGFDQFGRGITFDNDDLIIGASSEDDGGSNAGAAYLFSRDQGGADNWGEVKKITASDPVAGDQFGISADISGDNMIIGGYAIDDNGNFSGAAYIFNRDQGGVGNWGQVKKLLASDGSENDQFGWQVTLDGDYAIVGAPGEDGGGAIYSFARGSGGANNWGQVSKEETSDGSGVAYNLSLSSTEVAIGTSGSEAVYLFEPEGDLSLPVSLSAFSAAGGDQKVTVRWATESEKNNEAFLLQRRSDGSNFSLITEIAGQGNSSQHTEYRYVDHAVINGQTYTYRLGDRDYSGQITWHRIVSVTVGAGEILEPIATTAERFYLHQNYPNPFNPETTIKIEVPANELGDQQVRLQVFNSNGQLVRTLIDSPVEAGVYEIRWDGLDNNGFKQASGVYFLDYQSAFNSKTVKMMLVR